MRWRNYTYIAVVLILALSLLTGFIVDVFGFDLGSFSFIASWVTSPVALLLGIAFALTCGTVFPDFNKVMSKKLLQYSVVGLGFGITLQSALASGAEGMLMTIVSVFATLGLGTLIGRKLLGVDWQTSYLISSGTAICGGSAIATVGPIIKAKAESMSVALGVVFILNAIALFLFPPIGHLFDMSQHAFGTWAAIAIHDTSSVVGAGGAYGDEAQTVATTVKLTRALWIVVIALLTPFFCKSKMQDDASVKQPWYKAVPTFIVWFIAAILLNTFVLSHFEVGQAASGIISKLAKQLITLSLFFIGASLTKKTLKAVGVKPMVQGILLWVINSVVTLIVILNI